MSEDQSRAEAPDPLAAGASRQYKPPRNDEGLAQLSTICGEYVDSYLILAQLHGQRWLLSLCKMFLLSIATLILLLAAWSSFVQSLLEIAVQMGVPSALAMLFVAVSNLALAWWCWGSLCRRLQRLVLRPSMVNRDSDVNGGRNAD